jgi:hypothetical protein
MEDVQTNVFMLRFMSRYPGMHRDLQPRPAELHVSHRPQTGHKPLILNNLQPNSQRRRGKIFYIGVKRT